VPWRRPFGSWEKGPGESVNRGSWARTQLIHEVEGCGGAGAGPLVVSGGDAAEILEAAEHELDEITIFVELGRRSDCERLRVGSGGIHGFDAAPGQLIAQRPWAS